MQTDNPMYEAGDLRAYSIISVDGLPGTCALCFADVPAVAKIESTDFDISDHERRHTTTLFACRDDAPARTAVLFDNPGRFELFNGILQPAA